MLERVPYQPSRPLHDETARAYAPTFLYRDPNDVSKIEILDEFYGSRRKLRLGILGAGITCINFLHFLEAKIPEDSIEVVVYEREKDVGGVWMTSNYPGCRCDMPGVVYQFSWRPNIWSEFYPPAKETREYIQTVARENNFYRFMKFRHKVTAASWTDEEAEWTLEVQNLDGGIAFQDRVDVFLDFSGPVNTPKITLDGLGPFHGKIMHPAQWDDSVDVVGKRVAVIGCGSSGVQLVPNIIDKVAKLYTWFRNKAFILPPSFPYGGEEGRNFKYTDEQKQLLTDPEVYLAYWKAVEAPSSDRVAAAINGSALATESGERVAKYMKDKLIAKSDVFDLLLPTDFEVGCRRPSFSHGYLEALASPKTTVLIKPPKCFTEYSIRDSDGEEHELDIIIAATGYDQSHLPRFSTTVNGKDVLQVREGLIHPQCYMSVCWKDMPNYFDVSSAYAPVQGPWYQGSEALVKYMVKIIDKMQIERIVSFVPRPKAVEHWIRHANAFNERMAQSGPCSTWFKAKDGRPLLWPGGRSHFMKVLENPRFEDLDMRYEDEGDMFSYMGNGFTLENDAEEDADKTWYLGAPKTRVDLDVLDKLRGTYVRPQPANEVVQVNAAP